MSVLRSLEEKIAGLVEGAFGRVFRSQVRPVELARKLAREMDEHKTVSVSRTYVPNEYAIWLSPEDRQRYEGVEQEVIDELSAYLLEHARRERLALVSRPVIEFRTDDRLHLGEFGIQARLVRPEGESAKQADHGHTMVYSTSDRTQESLSEASADRAGRRRRRAQPRVRRRARRLERVAPPRRDPARRRRAVDGRGPGLHERRAGQRPAHHRRDPTEGRGPCRV